MLLPRTLFNYYTYIIFSACLDLDPFFSANLLNACAYSLIVKLYAEIDDK